MTQHISIKKILEETQEMEKAFEKVDISYILEAQYKRSEYFLNELIIDVERNLIKKQKEDLPNESIIQRFEKTLNRMLMIQEHFNKVHSHLKYLELENEQLKQKFEAYKINIK
jgi:hypothetical protein